MSTVYRQGDRQASSHQLWFKPRTFLALYKGIMPFPPRFIRLRLLCATISSVAQRSGFILRKSFQSVPSALCRSFQGDKLEASTRRKRVDTVDTNKAVIALNYSIIWQKKVVQRTSDVKFVKSGMYDTMDISRSKRYTKKRASKHRTPCLPVPFFRNSGPLSIQPPSE